MPVDSSSLLFEAKKDLEDVPFEAEIHEFPAPRAVELNVRQSRASGVRSRHWFNRIFSGRAERRLREEMLEAELQDLRASYAGLLHSTEDIREQFEQ